MFKKTPLASAIGLATVAGALAGTAMPVLAADDSSAQTMEEVVVTGSRIKRADFQSNAPVATLGSDQINLTGTVNTESLMNTLPQMIPGFDRTSNNPGGGFATVNLRGLGSQRTLVLVDGTRMVPTTEGGTVDINDIPTALIDRVEVLTGGASAVYGSDAVAGVVNFILKDNFEGAEFNVGTQQTGKGDAGISNADLTLGANTGDGRGNVVMNLSWEQRDPLFQAARSYTSNTYADNSTKTGFDNAGSPGIPQTLLFGANFPMFNTDGSTRPFVSTGPNNDYYNYAPVNYLQLPQERYQATALGHYKFNDHFELYGRGLFTFSHVPQQLAPTPVYGTFQFTLDGSPFIPAATQANLSGNNTDNVGFGDRAAPVYSDGGASLNPDGSNTCTNCVFDSNPASKLSDGTVDTRFDTTPIIDANSNGVADTATAFLGRRMVEVGNRISDNDFTAFQLQTGARGQLAGSWDYDVYAQYGHVGSPFQQLGNINTGRFQQALLLDLSDPTGGTCSDPSSNGGTSSCAPINIFGAGNISQAGADFVNTAVAALANYRQTVYSANFSGNLFELPGGTAGAAVGYEHMDVNANYEPSQDLAASSIAGFNGSPASGGGYHVNSYYGEVRLPFVTGAPMMQELSAELAYRSSDYTTAGTVDSYKASFSWAPINQIRFRGGYNTAVRAPSISELYSPQGENFPGAVDPCSAEGTAGTDTAVASICTATGVPAGMIGSAIINAPAGQIRELTGGNPTLHQEKADTYTFGVVISPEAVPGLTASVDYYNIKIKDAIASFGGGTNNVLTICYDPTNPAGGAGSDFCNVVHRRANGSIDFVSITQQNVASLKQAGVDVLASYATDMLGGSVKVDYVGTFTNKQEFEAYTGATPIICQGHFGLNCGQPIPKYKHRVTFNYSRDNWTGQVLWRMIGKVTDDDPSTTYVVESISAKHYFDGVVSYQFNDNYSLSVGAYNLADSKPPLIGDNQEQANTYPETYDVFGRTFYVKATAKF